MFINHTPSWLNQDIFIRCLRRFFPGKTQFAQRVVFVILTDIFNWLQLTVTGNKRLR